MKGILGGGITTVLFAVVAAFSQFQQDLPRQPGRQNFPAARPYRHKVLSATSRDGLRWTRDEGMRMEHASVPCAVAAGDRIFLYYVDADRGPGQPESIGCATSSDGIRFEKQPFTIEGMTARKALDPSVLRDPDGKFRLYYLAIDERTNTAGVPADHRINLALSDDGIRFRDAGAAFVCPMLVDPDVFLYKNRWFMYVFGGQSTPNGSWLMAIKSFIAPPRQDR